MSVFSLSARMWFMCGVAVLVLTFVSSSAAAQSTSELQNKIDEHNAQISALEKEIKQYESELETVSAKKKTLQNTLSQLDLQRKKLSASINQTKNRIQATQLEIQRLSRNIESTGQQIEHNEDALAESMRRLNEADNMPLIEALLVSGSIADAWNDVDQTNQLQDAVDTHIDSLNTEKTNLTNSKTKTEEKKTELLKQQQTLVSQQGSLDATRKAQNELLTQTKSQESNYQKLIADKQSAKTALESALSNLKAQFNYQIDPSQITPAGKGILVWPTDSVRITQYFGNTPFARSGAYAGKGHNGIDIGIPIGTPLKAALTGTVIGTGNTDSVRGCYSFGKWIMIKHANGLSTLYAHMSQINVSEGQDVGTGQVIGYSGETGYATGPHLHFGVYASSAVKIIPLGQATNSKSPCSGAVMPVAPLSGYLNPMDYLPG